MNSPGANPFEEKLNSMLYRNDTKMCNPSAHTYVSKTTLLVCNDGDSYVSNGDGLLCQDNNSNTYNAKCPPCTVFNGFSCVVLSLATDQELENVYRTYKSELDSYNALNNISIGSTTHKLPIEPVYTLRQRGITSVDGQPLPTVPTSNSFNYLYLFLCILCIIVIIVVIFFLRRKFAGEASQQE